MTFCSWLREGDFFQEIKQEKWYLLLDCESFCLWGGSETPLKTCPLLELAVSQNTSHHDSVAAQVSRAWATAWSFRSDLALHNQYSKSWHKLKHLRNLRLGLVEHGAAQKFANIWATGSSSLPLFLYLCLGKAGVSPAGLQWNLA